MAIGKRKDYIQSVLEDEPVLRRLWEEYTFCRHVQWVTFKQTVDKNKEQTMHIMYPTGITLLPFGGSVGDLPHMYFVIFSAFLSGEREGAVRSAQKQNLIPIAEHQKTKMR